MPEIASVKQVLLRMVFAVIVAVIAMVILATMLSSHIWLGLAGVSVFLLVDELTDQILRWRGDAGE